MLKRKKDPIMNRPSIQRRGFLKAFGIGSAAGSIGLFSATVISGTADGQRVRSFEVYGGFDVEKLKPGKRPYETDPDVLKSMRETNTVFSRNVWDPERRNRPRENLTHERLVEGQGKIPNQTRLDYALYAASWHTASARTSENYSWELYPRMVRGTGLPDLGPWDPGDIDMGWEEASLAVKHAALFYGASQAGIAELNPLWVYSDGFTPTQQDRKRSVPVLADGDRFGQTDDAWYIPESMNRVVVIQRLSLQPPGL